MLALLLGMSPLPVDAGIKLNTSPLNRILSLLVDSKVSFQVALGSVLSFIN